MKLQNYIIENTITESINDKGILKACFFAGNPGAGKSYTLSKIGSGQVSPRVVNVDKWVEHLNTGYETPEHTRAQKLTENEVYLYVNSMLPLFVDSTSTSTQGVVRRRNVLEKVGYDTAIIFVKTSLETSIKRVQKRNEEGKRIVPIEKVKEYYKKAMQVNKFLKHAFKFYLEINNDDDEFTDEIVIKAYNRVSAFFGSPVKNKIGSGIIEVMKKNGWKYLTDGVYTEQNLKQIVDNWYRSV